MQESVWDYPRPPALETVPESLKLYWQEHLVAETQAGWRVLETSHPPVYYFPRSDVNTRFLKANPQKSFCEWKGNANYWDLIDPDTGTVVYAKWSWSYPDPTPRFADLKDALAFYLKADVQGFVGEELATPQPGEFYGGWVTSKIVGPFKGVPGSWGW